MIKQEGYEFASLLNEFAFKLYNNTRLSNKNGITSPAQLMISLSVLAIASDEGTEKQFQRFFGYGDPSRLGGCLVQGMKEVIHWIDKQSITQIKVEKTVIIKHSFAQFLSQIGLKSEVFFEQVDFVKGSQAFKKGINEKVKEVTGNQQFIPDGHLNSFIRILIINALKFECEFHTPFSERLTTFEPFVVSNSSTNHKSVLIEVPIMQQIGFYKLFDDRVATYVSLPLKNFRFHLDIILPKIHIQEYEAIFNFQAYAQYQLQSVKTKVHIRLPRFKISPPTTQTLKSVLTDMGISDAFDQKKCNFSKLESSKSSHISEIFSSPVIEVHEADLTNEQTLEIPKYTQPPIEVTVNRPFLFLVRESVTNSILIFGKLLDPQQME